ncbi:MAG TPA: cystathionine gamma-synthase, partial [Thermoanaerobaculia bacterium]|nr:cystathionine gamma-synthase [Thermoanaerobaculia bacterium]
MTIKDTDAIETLCVHAGVEPDAETGAIMTPIYQTSTYVQQGPGDHKGYDYSRGGNPTRTVLENALAALEGARHAISFSSGLAAEQAIIQTLDPGDHVLVSQDVYGGTGRLFRKLFAKYGIEFEFIDLREPSSVEQKVRPNTRMIWAETPTNPLMQIVDIAALGQVAKRAGARLVVDNTFCSPVLQRPLDLGADIVVHSTTKYIGGHSDLIGGAVMLDDDAVAEQIRFVQFAGGAVNSPFESFLLLRSIKTLALRMRQHSENALAFATALEADGSFEDVLYPGLESHPQHELARRQMSGFSGMVSVYLDGGMERVTRFLQALKIFSLAESLGGVESLVNHPETMTHASVPPELRAELGIHSGLVRFSVGIENVNDLIEDVRQA